MPGNLFTAMIPWTRFVGRLPIILLWLFFISLPIFAFLLAARQEIKIGGDENHLRIFILQEKESEGIGIELSRSSLSLPSCTQTAVNYFMWVGEPDNVAFCHCVDPQTGYALPVTQGACNSP